MKLILDTNLLLLYFVGNYDSNFISQCRTTRGFTEQDYIKLIDIVKSYKEILITPQILAEVSNFSKRISEPKFSLYMQSLIKKLFTFKEKHIPMIQLLNDVKNLTKLGFTDLSIIEVSKKYNCVILTKDFELYQIAISEGGEAVNYNHFLDN